MAQFTKTAIINSFVKLLNENTFDKITVKDIVKDCGINRNTFYYYYQDIYSLLCEILKSETERVIAENNVIDSWDDGLLKSLDFVFENKTAIRHLYSSINRAELERYLYDITDDIMMKFIMSEAEGLDASEDDIKLIATFYKAALVGMSLDWIGKGMPDTVYSDMHRLHDLFNGSIREALLRVGSKEKAE